jgi:hypothetical protein
MTEVISNLFFSFLPLIFLVALVYVAVKASKNSYKTTIVRGLVISLVIISAIPAGLIATYYLPTSVLNFGADATFGTRLTIGSVMIIAGIFLKSKTQKYFLLFLGLAIVLMQIPYVWSAYGTKGGLVTVAAAFVALVAGTIWLTLRGKNE